MTALDRVLRTGVSAVVVTPRAQNPSSAAITPDRAARLRDVLAAHPHLLVVEDDHASVVAGPDAVTLTTDRERFAVVRSSPRRWDPTCGSRCCPVTSARSCACADATVWRRRPRSAWRSGPCWSSGQPALAHAVAAALTARDGTRLA